MQTNHRCKAANERHLYQDVSRGTDMSLSMQEPRLPPAMYSVMSRSCACSPQRLPSDSRHIFLLRGLALFPTCMLNGTVQSTFTMRLCLEAPEFKFSNRTNGALQRANQVLLRTHLFFLAQSIPKEIQHVCMPEPCSENRLSTFKYCRFCYMPHGFTNFAQIAVFQASSVAVSCECPQ
jgi:hypothetical protein